MPDPIITVVESTFDINHSNKIHFTADLALPVGTAEFTVTAATAPASIILDRTASGSIPITFPAPGVPNTSIAGRAVSWSGTATDFGLTVEAIGGGAVEEWKLRLELPAGAPDRHVTVERAGSASVTAVEVDPVVQAGPPLTLLEGQTALLQGTMRRNRWQTPALAGPGCSHFSSHVWSQAPGDSYSATITPDVPMGPTLDCHFNANVTNLPVVAAPVTLNFILTATTTSGFTNSATTQVTINSRTRRTLLVLDRSGSMAGSRWENAKIGAHVWLDLFDAFRQGLDPQDKVGIVVFEDDIPGFRASGSVDTETTTVFPGLGSLPGSLPALPNPNSLSLGAPGDNTNIGDGLIEAFNKLAATPGAPASTLYTIVLLTDGEENAGLVRVDKETPPPFQSGVEIFNTIKNNPPRQNFVFSGPTRNVEFYTIGVGAQGAFPADVLNDLAYNAGGAGVYLMVNDASGIIEAYKEIITKNVGAQSQTVGGAATVGGDPSVSGQAAYFLVPQGEAKLAVVVLRDGANQIEVSWRRQTDPPGAPFQLLNNPGGIAIHSRASHFIAVINLSFNPGSGALNSTGTHWRVQRKDAGAAVLSIDSTKVLAARDLRVRTVISFDRDSYGTGQPMKITAHVGAGGLPVNGAVITVSVEGPELSLGTFLAQASARFQVAELPAAFAAAQPAAPTTATHAPHVSASAVAGQTADLPTPKRALLSQLLSLSDLSYIPTVPLGDSVFVDGSNRLHDDGAHGDGAAGDGVYANTFDRAAKEGTYTFRFRIDGQAPDGSRFSDTVVVSRWVGIDVDPFASVVGLSLGTVASGGLVTSQVFVRPADKGGELLGPFHSGQVRFTSPNSAFRGEVVSHPDGRYSQTILHKQGETPLVKVFVQGKEVKGVASAEGCLSRIPVIGQLLRWLGSLVGLGAGSA